MKVSLKANFIRRKLIKKCKSQNWLAYRMGISSGYISQLMDGSRNPSPAMCERFLKAFPECEFNHLFLIKERG
jgi:transcriptional regulator with XRE-family HTH domain